MDIEPKSDKVATPPSTDGGGGVPSGFILKLFQMVNGAPDDVICWTPSGDAFIIGSDLERLESETLPQFFRHNRFQSLVRQLNFYSFRKINRERNVWIYKHKLFHRDRPEDLHMVRRRTCPGVDGRKQRFSRYSAQRLSRKFADKEEDSDESSMSDSEESDAGSKKKRSSTDSKRSRGRLWQLGSKPDKIVVDSTPVADPSPSPTSVFHAPNSLVDDGMDEDDSSANKKSDRMEQIEQSLIVSEVASKLEEFARKAMKGRGSSRTRRGDAGVVTPPWGSSGSFNMSTEGLITYDDECLYSGFVSDNEDSDIGSTKSPSRSSAKAYKISSELLVAPVANAREIGLIVSQVRGIATKCNSEAIGVCAYVVGFLMSTAPSESIHDSCSKIVELLSISHKLAVDFHFYRAALHPESAGDNGTNFSFEQNHADALRNALEGGSGQNEVLREFKIFAINLVYKLLGRNGSFAIQDLLAKETQETLLHTAEAWSKSVGTVA